MIVVAIIGVLASVAIPTFSKYIRKAKTSEAKTFVKRIYDGARAYYLEPNYGTKSISPVPPQFPRNDFGFTGAGSGPSGSSVARNGVATGEFVGHLAGNGGNCCAITVPLDAPLLKNAHRMLACGRMRTREPLIAAARAGKLSSSVSKTLLFMDTAINGRTQTWTVKRAHSSTALPLPP